MTGAADNRKYMIAMALNSVPPIIRESLLEDNDFQTEFEFKPDAVITFGIDGVAFQRSVLYDAVRSVFSGDGSIELDDLEKRSWTIKLDDRENGHPTLFRLSDQKQLLLTYFSVLSKDVSLRLRSLEEYAASVNLPHESYSRWRSILEERMFEDDEFDTFRSDIFDTPAHQERVIRSQLVSGRSNISSLVPISLRYYERLVGAFDGCASIPDYAAKKGRKVFSQLSEWKPYEGFLFSLLLSSHSALTAEIDTDTLSKEELEKAFDHLLEYGDPLSQLGAFEVGLRILPKRPEVEPFLFLLLKRIIDDEPSEKKSEFKLLSALFVLVDGELSRTRLFADKPPFYRRLASLAQASLIQRQLVQGGIDYERFTKWALSNCIERFFMQSFADMRSEPRWNPHMTDSIQFHADFIGRIIIAGNAYQANLSDGELRNALLGEGAKELIEHYGFLRPFFPGPLEGTEGGLNVLPDELSQIIVKQLDSDEIEAASFAGLVNLSRIYTVQVDHVELAVNALKSANHRLANLLDKNTLLAILEGLATLSAVNRSQELSDQLLILVRRYRHDSQYALTVEEAFGILIVAAAARKELTEWRSFVGDFLTELAFCNLEENEGGTLHSHLSILLHCVPELWVSCAKADAALQAFRFR
ncbi:MULTISPECIES: hypothetical protein [unclassified Prosthecochloris]|uniref:hypothetical protein n=1 Tax=unclassified Prosthecochloris TaxID=2632826 RepID=UPI00223CEB9C|nr:MULTISPECIES: hypothetical protein [unclassified Prosthecochloris]UZJ37365.1 hypothetical protein OO005_11530 [Prosthecochloris sp. SCSIO W1103]UZJ39186.1 hypothetical protein OO185_04440 [Prosthecochloris sp. SCSIO W1102]